MAFSYETKYAVTERMGRSPRSELSGRTDFERYEYMHLVHGKSLDNPDNCKFVNIMEHLAYHLYWYDNPEAIGLTKQKNIWSIKQVTARVTQYLYENNRLHEYDEDLSSCLNGWAIYFEQNELPHDI